MVKPRLFQRPDKPSPINQSEGFSHFPFLGPLVDETEDLMQVKTPDKLAAFQSGANFFLSKRGRLILPEVIQLLASNGYPESSARYELSLLPDFLAKESLDKVVSNPASLYGGAEWLDGGFTKLNSAVFITGFPVGPLLVIGSGNSLMPAIVSVIEGLIANCPVVVRGSRFNREALERILTGLQEAGNPILNSLIAKVHPFFLDHTDPGDAKLFSRLLQHGPFAAGIFFGGEEALDYLITEFSKNPRHPMVIPMEPMTGVAVVSQQYISLNAETKHTAAQGLAKAVLAMGQQLCSSPTEAYYIGDMDAAVAFTNQVAAEMEGFDPSETSRLSESQALLLDRVRNQLEEYGSTVLVPRTKNLKWTLIVSRQESNLKRIPADCQLHIHRRSGFLELIVVNSLKAAANLISALPTAPCHQGIKRVQTVLRLTNIDEAKELALYLRKTGIYRVVPPEYVILRHALEPLDGRHLIADLTRQIVVF